MNEQRANMIIHVDDTVTDKQKDELQEMVNSLSQTIVDFIDYEIQVERGDHFWIEAEDELLGVRLLVHARAALEREVD